MNTEVDRLMSDYIDYREHPSHDAGWLGDSIEARFIEYGGTPPAATGNDKSNEKMINDIRGLKDIPAHYLKAKDFVDRMLRFGSQDVKLALQALLLKNKMKGLDEDLKPYTDAHRAAEIGIDARVYGKLLKLGYRLGEIYLKGYRHPINEG